MAKQTKYLLDMKNTFITLLMALFLLPLSAEVKLPSIFTSNMVLQQESTPAIWGWAESKNEVTVTTSWNQKTYTVLADKEGYWKTNVETPSYGGPYEVTVSESNTITLKNVLIGEVWLCAGQSNMEMPMKGFRGQSVAGANMAILKSKSSNIRLIDVPRKSTAELQTDFEGEWKEATPETVANFSATGYFFGRLVNEMLDIPIGLISVNYGGSCVQAWMSKETAVPFEDRGIPKKDEDIGDPNRTPTALFNGMLNPVIGYGLKGAIYYQGETNFQEPDKYLELFPTMVAEWRALWNCGEFPFYYAQIAPFDYTVFLWEKINKKDNSAYLRDAQRKAMEIIPSSGMAVLLDCGEKDNIHPRNKEAAGTRLALWALAETYGLKGFSYKNPTVNEISIDGSVVTVSFNDAEEGITSYGKEVTLFEVAGENKRFYPAKVKVRTKSLLISSPEVKKPVAVRYAFKDYVKAELFNNFGLPLSSFRTDDW